VPCPGRPGGAVVLSALWLSLLLTAILGALLRRGTPRAFWIGSALFGGAYFASTLTWPGSFPGIPTLDRLVATPTLGLLEVLIAVSAGERKAIAGLVGAAAEVDEECRLVIGASALGLLFAGLGGLIASQFSRIEGPARPRLPVASDPPPP
jgi:hypothetical protein